jgi:hypothetical protein
LIADFCRALTDGGAVEEGDFSIASREDETRPVLAAFKGKKRGKHIGFASIELLWKVLSPKGSEPRGP